MKLKIKSNMYYVIQENLFREYHFRTLIEHLERSKLSYEVVPFRPFTDELQVKSDRKDVWFFGSVNGTKVAEKYGWKPGVMYNDNHDLEVYGKYYGDNMLNADGTVLDFGTPLPPDYPPFFFARPTKDTKVFSGQMFSRDGWEEWAKDLRDSNLSQSLNKETKILIAPLKTTQQEIRCWIVDGKLVTASQYKIGNRVNYLNMDNNQEVAIFAKQMCKLYCPAKAFVLDICLYQDEYKVVEINCINCSGFYDGDMSKLIQSLENTFN